MGRLYFGKMLYYAKEAPYMLDDEQCKEFFDYPLTYCVLRCVTLDPLAEFLIRDRNSGGAYVTDEDAQMAVHAAISLHLHVPSVADKALVYLEKMFEGRAILILDRHLLRQSLNMGSRLRRSIKARTTKAPRGLCSSILRRACATVT